MKNKKAVRMLVLFGVIVLLLIVYMVLRNYNKSQEEKEDQEAESEVILSFDESDIKNISFIISDERVSFTKEEEDWIYDSDASFPVDQEQIGVLTDSLAEVTANRTLEEVKDLSDYGLDDPEDIIQVTAADDTVTKITVGNTNESTGDCYIYLNDDNKTVYTVTGDLSTVFSGSLMNYAKGEDYPTITSGNIKKIELSGNENSFMMEKSDSSTSGWVFTDASGSQVDVDSSYVSSLQSVVSGFTYANYYDYNCSDFSIYGLDQPYAVLTVDYTETVTSEDGDESEDDSEEEEQTEEVDKKMVLYIGNESDDGNRYVYTEGSAEVHGISSESLMEILQPSDENVENKSVSNIPIASLNKLTVKYDGASHEYVMKEEKTESESDSEEETASETVYYRDGEKLDSLSFSSFYNKAIGMTAQEITEDNADGEAEMSMVFEKSDGTSVTVDYYAYDTNFYLAARQDGKKYLINKMNVREMFTAYEEITAAE